MVELLSVCHCIRYAKSPVAGNRSFVYHEGGVFVLWIIPLSVGLSHCLLDYPIVCWNSIPCQPGDYTYQPEKDGWHG
jgi:hypothetical protein